MLNESAMKKWFRFEMGKINSGIVTKKKRLCDLADSDSPRTLTKDGSTYYFDSEVIKRLWKVVPERLHNVKLPLSLYSSLEIRGNVYIAEKTSLDILKYLDEIPKNAELIEGKYWMGKTIAKDIMRRYPTMMQFVRY
jgi:uncharacterized protein (UPF0216 family)